MERYRYEDLGSIRTITGDRNTIIDPHREATNSGTGHTHANLSTLNQISEEDQRIKMYNQFDPVPLIEADW